MSIEPEGDGWDTATSPVYLCFDGEDLYAARRVTGFVLANDDLDHYVARENAPLDSDAARTIQRQLAARLAACRAFVCLIGPLTAENPWVAWEIETVRRLAARPGLVGTYLDERHERPAGLQEAGAVWVPFNRDHLARAVQWAFTSDATSDDFEFRDMAW